MQIYYPEIAKKDIRIDQEKVLKLLGNQQDCVDAYSAGLVNQYIDTCIRISSPKGAFILTEAKEPYSPHELAILGTSFHTGKVIRKMLNHSESYALFLATAGPEPEELTRKLLEEGNYLEGYIADLVASYIVELTADLLEKEVRSQAESKGLAITNCYSPGYCSWDVAEQQKLFSLFPEKCCGISLSDSSLMSPVKSISGIIGIGALVIYKEYTCEICSMKNCKFRTARST